MRPVVCSLAPLLASACFVVFPLHVQAAEPEDSYLRFSKEIPFVSFHFLHGSKPWGVDELDEVVKSLKAIDLAMELPGSFDQLSALAEHADPRVRTLALMKLYALANPEAFRVIQRHLNDPAETFPKMETPLGRAGFEKPFFTTETASVGSYATSMLYMIGYPAMWGDREASFEAWSKPRLGNPDWIGWYDFRVKVARQRTVPIQPDAEAQVAAFKRELARCPHAVRAWLWFGIADDWLMSPAYDTPLATEAEMIEAGRKLGPDALLAFLKDGTRAGLREPKIDDPERGKRFILSHAKQFFREQDAPELATMGHYMAAADANPKMASKLIRDGLAAWSAPYHDHERGKAMAALLDLQPELERDFVVKWFYEPPLQSSYSGGQTGFLHEYQRRKPQGWQQTAKALVAHPEFEQLASLDTAYIALLVNALSGQKAFADEILNQQHDIELRNQLREYFGLETIKRKILDTPASPARKPVWTSAIEGQAISLSLSPDGTLAAVGREEGDTLLFDTAEGKAVGTIPATSGKSLVQFRKSDGALLVFSDRGFLTEWDAKTRTPLRQIWLGEFPANESALSESGQILGSRQGNEVGVSVYDVEKHAQRWNAKMPIRGFGMIAISPDGSRLAVADGWAKTILLFDTAKPVPIATLSGHAGVPHRAAFSPDGKYLLSTAEDTKAIIWDGRTGQLLHQYQRRQSFGGGIGFSADSKSFLLEAEHGQLGLFDVATGDGKQAFEAKSNYVQSIVADAKGTKWLGIEVGRGPEAIAPLTVPAGNAEPMMGFLLNERSCRLTAWAAE